MDNQEREKFALEIRLATADFLVRLRDFGVPMQYTNIEFSVPVGHLPNFGTGHKNITIGDRLYAKTTDTIVIRNGKEVVISALITVHEETPRQTPGMLPGGY
ncbi:hypothetical protein AB6805_29675 [Chitinophaga sp. RCC_12]|uniref:hypothetical protein n=1 Tax=Chitinophaga sp. RCC_12 TaxID=3239226 RepID=UPI0035269BF5